MRQDANMIIASSPTNNDDIRHVRMRDIWIRFMSAICCGLIGYIFGSMPNNNLQGHVDMKCTRQPFESDGSVVDKDVLSDANSKDDESGDTIPNQVQAHPTINKSVVEEIVPPTLQPFYQDIPFNVTRSMLRQSRPVIGNTQRLHSYFEKLRNKECTTVLFLGGSGKIYLSFYQNISYRPIGWLNFETLFHPSN